MPAPISGRELSPKENWGQFRLLRGGAQTLFSRGISDHSLHQAGAGESGGLESRGGLIGHRAAEKVEKVRQVLSYQIVQAGYTLPMHKQRVRSATVGIIIIHIS